MIKPSSRKTGGAVEGSEFQRCREDIDAASGLTKFYCAYCNHSFSQSQSVTKHMKESCYDLPEDLQSPIVRHKIKERAEKERKKLAKAEEDKKRKRQGKAEKEKEKRPRDELETVATTVETGGAAYDNSAGESGQII